MVELTSIPCPAPSPSPGRRLRLACRCGALAAAFLLAWPVVPWAGAPLVVPAASPFVAIAAAVATRSLGIVALVALPVLLISLVRRRWFCRWACPVGLLTEQAGRLGPSSARWLAKVPPLGQWIVWITLAGACLGYPLLLWLDPLALFSGFLVLRQWPTGAGLVAGLGLPIVVLLSAALPQLWCRQLCPLGATQELLALPQTLLRRREPAGDGQDRSWPWARRSVLAAGLGALWAMAALRTSGGEARRPIRPPGALPAGRFARLCLRCGNCIRACPAKILHADLGEHGVAGFLTPVVRFEEDYCRKDCRRCIEVCPSGAIARLSLAEKQAAPMAQPKLDLSRCLLADNGECTACINACPYHAIRIAWNDEDYVSYPEIDLARCPGCGACQVACVATPKAIVVGGLSDARPTPGESP